MIQNFMTHAYSNFDNRIRLHNLCNDLAYVEMLQWTIDVENIYIIYLTNESYTDIFITVLKSDVCETWFITPCYINRPITYKSIRQ